MSSTQVLCPSRRKLLPATILASLAAASPLTAEAVALSEASYDVTFATAGPPPIGPGSGLLGSMTFSDPLDVLDFSSPGGVSTGIHTFGQPDGSFFGSRSSGEINGTDRAYRVDGDFTLMLEDISAATLNFNIIPGQVRAQAAPTGGLGLQAGDFQKAEMVLSIKQRDGASTDPNDFVEIFGAMAMALVDHMGAVVEWSGDDIGFGCPMGPTSTAGGTLASCSIAGGAFSVGLGAGAQDIMYTLSTVASGSISVNAGTCGFGGFDNGSDFGNEAAFNGDGIPGGASGGPCRSAAQIGDPLAFVPEPASLGLAALGLVAMARMRRKQVSQAA